MTGAAAPAPHAEFGRYAPDEGANAGPWPGLTVYRYSRPTRPQWAEVDVLSVAMIAHSGAALTVVGEQLLDNGFNYVVAGGRRDFDCRIVAATPEHPVLCVMLRIDPLLVRAVTASLHTVGTISKLPNDTGRISLASPVDDNLTATVVRFLGALSTGCDRRVLAPLYLQELVFRLLQGDQSGRLVHLAARQATANPVAAALDFIAAHLAEPITIEILAAQVSLSTSAFSRVFRDVTGRSPYQFVKRARLNHGRQLLDEGRLSVTDVSRAVGYTSVSHFIKQFSNRFGVTPGDYVDGHTFRGNVRALHPLESFEQTG